MSPFIRFARFNVVGLMGVGVQVATLAVLVHGLAVGYLAATAMALGITLAHNFAWHLHWTWRDRTPAGGRWPTAFARFVGANGMVSLLGNLGLMPLLVDGAGLAPVPANVVAIAACGLVNYWLGGRVSFPDRNDIGSRFSAPLRAEKTTPDVVYR